MFTETQLRLLLNGLCVALVSSVANVYAQMESPNALYQAAVAALDKNDCTTAISYLEKYKIERAEVLKNNPKFAGDIELQIANCRQARGFRIIAEAEPSMDAGGAAGGAGTKLAEGAGGAVVAVGAVGGLAAILLGVAAVASPPNH